MVVSRENSHLVYEGIRASGIRLITTVPDTWILEILRLAQGDPDMAVVQVAREEEAVGIAAGAWIAGKPNLILMQNHGFLASINGIVSLALLYRLPLVMLITLRGGWGESYPWHTQGGILTEPVLRGLGLPFEHARESGKVSRQICEALTYARSSLSPVALLLTRELMEE